MRIPKLGLAGLLLVAAIAGRAAAQTAPAAPAAPPSFYGWHVARLKVLYTVDPAEDPTAAGKFPARGVRVGVFTRKSFFGSPVIQSAHETDPTGEVVLRYKVSKGERVTFRLETDGSHAKTFPGAWNLFATPHRKDVKLSAGESMQDVDRELVFGSELNRAILVQSAGTTARVYGETVFRGVAPGVRTKVSYSYPAWMARTTSSTPLPSRCLIADKPDSRSHGAVFHETGHTFWYAARGHIEYYWPFSHSMTERAKNPHLAMSEGFADWFAILVRDSWGASAGAGTPHEYDIAGEVHQGATLPFNFVGWGDDNETNVACALYDLVDMVDDTSGLVATFSDHSHLASLEDGVRAVYKAVRRWSTSRLKLIRMKELWREELRRTFGQAGADALAMNGVSP